MRRIAADDGSGIAGRGFDGFGEKAPHDFRDVGVVDPGGADPTVPVDDHGGRPPSDVVGGRKA